ELRDDARAGRREPRAGAIAKAAGAAATLAMGAGPPQPAPLLHLLEDLLFVRQVELDIEEVLLIDDHRVTLEFCPVVHAESRSGRLLSRRDHQANPEGPELGPDFLSDPSVEQSPRLGWRGGCQRPALAVEHEDGMTGSCRHSARPVTGILPSGLTSRLRRLPVIGLGAASSVRS